MINYRTIVIVNNEFYPNKALKEHKKFGHLRGFQKFLIEVLEHSEITNTFDSKLNTAQLYFILGTLEFF